ncbi:hypothetical protein HPP92_016949 [Vanilla planifolia]|uniref:Uncharacterized protein n=1 Tax=Vanilla planifolia TaxID=51239 RepID=A0A835USK0_VANPL|nr:hypothetical protein HPP92_016949 [Vanilla planifolia]
MESNLFEEKHWRLMENHYKCDVSKELRQKRNGTKMTVKKNKGSDYCEKHERFTDGEGGEGRANDDQREKHDTTTNMRRVADLVFSQTRRAHIAGTGRKDKGTGRRIFALTDDFDEELSVYELKVFTEEELVEQALKEKSENGSVHDESLQIVEHANCPSSKARNK